MDETSVELSQKKENIDERVKVCRVLPQLGVENQSIILHLITYR